MPIYEYRCSACGHHLEALQKMAEASLRKCPECGKSQLKRLVSAPQFRLKGSGWYETDFKNKSSATGKAAPGKSADTSGSEKSASGTESSGGDKSAGEKGSEKSSTDKKADSPAPSKPSAAP